MNQIKEISNILHGNVQPKKKHAPTATVTLADLERQKAEQLAKNTIAVPEKCVESPQVPAVSGPIDNEMKRLMQKHIGKCSYEELEKAFAYIHKQNSQKIECMNLSLHIHMDK